MRYVYLIMNTANGKVYVGQTKNLAKRKAQHLYAARKGNRRSLYRSIRKYGEESFLFEALEECEDVVINEREEYWVAHYDSFNSNKGYNLTSGGGQLTKICEVTKQRISRSLKGHKRSEEHCKNISKGKACRPSGWKGRKQTEEHIINRVASFKSSVSSHKPRMTDEAKVKLSHSMKGKNTGPKSEEHKRKISESLRRRYRNNGHAV